MAESTSIGNSLLTEHLRWTPLSLIDDVINSVNELLYRAVGAVETGLLAAPAKSLGFGRQQQGTTDTAGGGDEGPEPAAKAEIENGVHQLETLLEATIDRNFDKLEIYLLRSVLAIPEEVAPWIRLEHYENLNFTSSADAPTQESIDLQRRKLRETERLHAELLQQSSRNAALISQLRALLAPPPTSVDPAADSSSPFAFLAAHPAAQALSVGGAGAVAPAGTQPLATTASFAASQLPSLRALLNALRPKLASLPNTGVPVDAAYDERVQYAEGQVRRHLTVTRGLELDEQGAVREGEWQGAGRKLAAGEVQSLEEAVLMLGGDGQGKGEASE